MHLWRGLPNLHSLRVRLTLFLGALLILFVNLTVVTGLTYLWVAERTIWYDHQEAVAQVAARQLATILSQSVQALQLIAQLEPAATPNTLPILKTLGEQNPAILAVAWFDGQGEILLHHVSQPLATAGLASTAQTAWLQSVQAGNPHLGEHQVGLAAESSLILALPAAGGVVAAQLSRAALADVAAWGAADSIRATYIVDHQGALLVALDPASQQAQTLAAPLVEALSRRQWLAGIRSRSPEGERVIGVLQAIPQTDWVVVAEVDEPAIWWRLGWALAFFVLMALLVALLALRASSRYVRYVIFDPLEQLRAGATEVSRGDLTQQLEVRRPDEIGMLVAAFNEMVEKLRTRETQLAATAADYRRTAEELAHSEATNRAIVAAIPDLLLLVRRDGLIIGFKAAQRVPAWAGPWLVDQPLAQALPAPTAQTLLETIDQVLTAQTVLAVEFQLPTEPGAEFEAQLASINDQEVLIIVRDITQRKQREALLQSTLEHERRLGEMKSRFMTLMSHEFRTPLAIILTFSNLLERTGSGLAPEKRTLYFGSIRTQVIHLAHILDDMLIASRADTVGLDYAPQLLPFVQFCQTLAAEFEPLLEGRQLDFQSNITECEFYFDAKLMRQAITNLFSNAIKYSLPGSTITVNLTCAEAQIQFSIHDVGIGIPAEDQAQLFEVMHRGSNVNYRPGIGLGLAIVKLAVEQHGGTVTFVSQVNAGTTFTITLPCGPVGGSGSDTIV